MFKKKVVFLSAISAALVTLSPMSALAGVHHGNSYPVCQTDGCSQTDVHQHGQDTYCGHSLNDGHSYHTACSRSDCENQEIHEHDGICYYGHGVSYPAAETGGAVQRNVQGRHHSGSRSGHHGSGHH